MKKMVSLFVISCSLIGMEYEENNSSLNSTLPYINDFFSYIKKQKTDIHFLLSIPFQFARNALVEKEYNKRGYDKKTKEIVNENFSFLKENKDTPYHTCINDKDSIEYIENVSAYIKKELEDINTENEKQHNNTVIQLSNDYLKNMYESNNNQDEYTTEYDKRLFLHMYIQYYLCKKHKESNNTNYNNG